MKCLLFKATYCLFFITSIFISNNLVAAEQDTVLLDEVFSKCEWVKGLPDSWKGAHAVHIKLIKEGNSEFLRIKNTDPKKVISLSKRLTLLKGVSSYTITVKIRCKNLVKGLKNHNNARIILNFRDKKYKILGAASSPQLSKDSKWRVISKRFRVPTNAKNLIVIPCLFNATGIFDIEYIKIRANKVNKVKETNQASVKKKTSCREEILLNGLWRFQPAGATGDGLIYVPGIWNRVNMNGIGSFAKRNLNWKGINFDKLNSGIYKRIVNIPENWKKRQITLTIDRLSTSGEVFLSNKKVGSLSWPEQELKISSKLINWGKNQELKIVVTAKKIPKNARHLMNPGLVVTLAEKLTGKGIIGDIFLSCKPKKHIDGIFIKTSVKNKTLSLDVELNDIKNKDVINFIATIKTLSGKVEKIFKATKTVVPGMRKVTLRWEWTNPKLWDVKQPNLYNLILSVDGSSLKDEILERFGFREIEIKGRYFYLNGKKIRFRPIRTFDTRYIGGVKPAIENNISGFLWAGFNFFEIGPKSLVKAGKINFFPLWAKAADEKGMPLAYSAFYEGMDFIKIASDPEAYQEWLKIQSKEWRKVRNCPSIFMLVVGLPCYYAHRDDQNPHRVGQRDAFKSSSYWQKKSKTGLKLVKSVREIDPTRIIATHHGATVGDIYSCNTYLNFIPLQEREDWLSVWSRKGNMPYASWEFGTPFDDSFLRGRRGHHQASTSEPLITEFSAALLGDKVYKNESEKYRNGISRYHIKGQKYRNMLYTYSNEKSFHELQQLFIKNTWRSWRTWGISGGMVPWIYAYGWTRFRYPSGSKIFDKYRIGERGAQLKSLRNYFYKGMKYWKRNATGNTFISVNQPVMVWIAGKKGAFTEKGHNFYSGQQLKKQIIVINDKREILNIKLKWQIKVGSKLINGTFEAALEPGMDKKFPIQMKLPELNTTEMGEINLSYSFDDKSGTDAFDFKVFPRQAISDNNLNDYAIWDPAGKTKKLYESLGFKIKKWDTGSSPKVLIIGANAFTTQEIPKGFKKAFFTHLAQGKNILIFGQQPKWYRQKGLRINRHVLRRVFPVSGTESVITKDLKATDFRDWQGEGQLVAEEQYTEISDQMHYYGWHWKNRGSVCSAPIEKPHFSTWTPILECGFDLAYSPLMEMNYDKAKIIFCSLDLERKITDSVSNLVAKRILNYASDTKVKMDKSFKTFAIGEERVFKYLDLLGVNYKKVNKLPNRKALVIIGPKARINEKKRKEFLAKGGKLIHLGASDIINGKVVKAKSAKVSNLVNDPVFNGISLSDLHLRSNIEFNKINSLKNGIIAANGMLGVRRQGSGIEIFIQLLPEDLPAASKTYFRFSRWRLCRLLAQLLANNGASFSTDEKFVKSIFMGSAKSDINLTGNWKFKVEKLYPQSPGLSSPTNDNGNKGYRKAWAELTFDDSSWANRNMPCTFEETYKNDGAFWVRKTINIPKEWQGKDLILYLGYISDCDISYFNGKRVGAVDASTKQYWNVERKYTIPAKLVMPGKNVVAIRIFDRHNAGGIRDGLTPMHVRLKSNIQQCKYYYPDYRSDFSLGDDPARYCRW